MRINSINPVNGQVIQSYQTHSSKEVGEIIKLTQKAWEKWRDATFPIRSDHLYAAAKILRNRKEELAILMALEMGKPLHDRGYDNSRSYEAGYAHFCMQTHVDVNGTRFLMSTIYNTLTPLYKSLFSYPILNFASMEIWH